MNTDSCRQLYRDCLRPSSIDGHKELVWWKWRNGGCQLSKDLPIKDKHKISTVKAIEILLETTAALHKNAPDNYKSFCFFTHKMNGRAGGGGNQIMLVSTKRWSIWFKQLQNRYPALQGFNYTWDMIRSSKLIKVSLETNDPTRVKEEGQHKLYSTAMRYVDKLPERIRGERKIREFMEWFQVLTTLNIEDFAKKAGISEKEYNKRAKKIMEDYYDFGGISCKDPTAGFNPEVPKGVFCSDVTKCLKCTGKRDVILGTTENMLSVMQWNERLKEMKIYFAGMPKDLWTQNWLLWEVFTANILANWKEDIQFRPEYRKAQEFLKTEKNPYKDIKFAEAVI